MKNLSMIIFLSCSILLLAVLANAQTVVITEVMYDDTASADLEWAEIHNTTGSAVNISGWILLDTPTFPPSGGEGAIIVPPATTINANAYLVLSKAAIPEFAGEVVCAEYDASWTLGNGGDNLALYTDSAATGTLVDGSLTLQYPDSAGTNEGNSIEKCDADSDWDDPTGWHESTNVFATSGRYRNCTPGVANSSCAGDTTRPVLVSVQSDANPVIDVTFSESLDPTTANTASNYSVNNGIGSPTSAVLQANNITVRLTFAAELPPDTYTLTVNNVEDVAGNPILTNSQIQFTIQLITEDLRFTEFMPNPNFAGNADSLGEWFEIYNAGSEAVNLNGWILADASGSDTIEAGNINVGQYFVFCSNGDSAENGGVPENYDYVYATSGHGVALNNTGETIYLRNASGATVSSLNYTGFPFSAGHSAQLRNLNDNPTIPANWCQADTAWNGSNNGDFGTPGAATICPAPFVPDTIAICVIRQQDTCGVPLRLGDRVVTRGVVSYVDTCRPIAYVQSNNCGVAVFGAAVLDTMVGHTRHMAAGDSVRLDGYITQFRGLTEFSTFAGFTPEITYLAAVAVPVSAPIPCVDISDNGAACAGEAYESRQVQVPGVTFVNGGGTFTHGDSSYAATCGVNTIHFFVDSCDAVFGTSIPTGAVNVNAIVTQYDTASCFCGDYQLVYGGGQTFSPSACSDPTTLTVYRTPGVNTESVLLDWEPGAGQTCNCYRIYYTSNPNGTFPADYTLLNCECGNTFYTDVVPISTTPRRYYVVTADDDCP